MWECWKFSGIHVKLVKLYGKLKGMYHSKIWPLFQDITEISVLRGEEDIVKNYHYLLGGVKYVYIHTPNLFLASMFHHFWQESTQTNISFVLSIIDSYMF